MSQNIQPELLAPAGSLKHLYYAFAYGADAIYAGIPRYSLRVRNNSFREEQIITGIHHAHAIGKKFYIAANIQPHNDKIKTFIRDIEFILTQPTESQPDALIMSDPGLIMQVRDKFPDIPIHLSVQANVVNWATAQFWLKQGIQRIILSRELGLEEIETFIKNVPEMEFEVFVHGALCMAYSGRCLLSGYMNHRDANQGACNNACRWKYDTKPAQETNEGQIALIEEVTKPGENMAVYEDQHGTYIMNSKDLRAVQHVQRLTTMGIHSLKIEGRTKSHYYVARTCQTYRQAIDDAMHQRPFNMALMDQLEKLSNRGYTEGFFRRHPPGIYQNYEQGTSLIGRHQFVGEIQDACAKSGELTILSKNHFDQNALLELMTPKGNILFRPEVIKNEHNNTVQRIPGSDHIAKVTIPAFIAERHKDYLSNLTNGLLICDREA